uniref:Chemosensory protein 6 n=1 Tax=Apocheima cinerarius TaxID=706528 RepID=A0A8T9EIA7_APOCI|nr:chemosensory protein 6 [Apocheima cinerarius]
MLKAFVLLVFVFIHFVAADFYSSKYDDFDVEPIIENDRIMLSYTKCFLDEGPCTPDAKDFKKIIPEALEMVCAKCTSKQKQLIRKVIGAIMEKHPEAWAQLTAKFDPGDKYKESFDKFIAGTD